MEMQPHFAPPFDAIHAPAQTLCSNSWGSGCKVFQKTKCTCFSQKDLSYVWIMSYEYITWVSFRGLNQDTQSNQSRRFRPQYKCAWRTCSQLRQKTPTLVQSRNHQHYLRRSIYFFKIVVTKLIALQTFGNFSWSAQERLIQSFS